MFPYSIKYTESEYDIQNNDFLYKIRQKCQNTFEMLEMVRKHLKKNYFQTMFPYRVKYTESEYDIQNNDLLYKIAKQCQNAFELLETFWGISKYFKKIKFLFCILYNFHNQCFIFLYIL